MSGVAWLAACGDDVEFGVAGHLTRGEPEPVRRDTIFRISSMTKPITAVAALILVEECKLRLDDPVDTLLPELADRKVLVDARGPLDGATVPAQRPITLHDLLTFRLGWGMDFEAPWPQPLLEAMGELSLGDGPPAPQGPPAPDEWIKRIGTLPLLYQPGQRWLYNVGSDVLGVLDRPRRRTNARRVHARAPVRTARHGRHRFLDGGRRPPRHVLHARPGDRGAHRLRRTRRSVGDCAGLPVRSGRARVDDRRRARLRADAVVRRSVAGRLEAALAGIGRGDDDRSDRCRAGCDRPRDRRIAGLGLRRRRAGAAHEPGAVGRVATAGRAGSARHGPTIRPKM